MWIAIDSFLQSCRFIGHSIAVLLKCQLKQYCTTWKNEFVPPSEKEAGACGGRMKLPIDFLQNFGILWFWYCKILPQRLSKDLHSDQNTEC
jgi:hypothetical protein